MALNIIMPNQPLLVASIIFYLYTDPGLGKSSLAHTADKPVVFDFDKGQHRVDSVLRRGAVVQIPQWSAIENQTQSDFEPFNTIVCDTVGAMLDCVKTHLSKNKENLQRDGNLTIKAQGLANNLFIATVLKWLSYGKDVVFIAHATEQESGKDKIKVVRPDLGGKNLNMLYRMADVMGYMHASTDDHGNYERNIYFNPSNTHHAKNSGNLGEMVQGPNGMINSGRVNVPDLMQNPTFLSDLIKSAKAHINTITPEQQAEIKAQADLANFNQMCSEANWASELNTLTKELDQESPYVKNMWVSIQLRAKELGSVFNKESKRWSNPPDFLGITDEQRDEIQELLADAQIDVMTFCEEQGIYALTQIEAQKFEIVKSVIIQTKNQALSA